MLMARLVDVKEFNGSKVDRVIALKFPAYYVDHPHVHVWLLHQHRQAYELWGTPYGDMDQMEDGAEIRDMIRRNDAKFLSSAKEVYTISRTVSDRLATYNGVKAMPLYHPPELAGRLRCGETGDYILCVSRINPIKRQRLLIESLEYAESPVKIVLAGEGESGELDEIVRFVKRHGLSDRVSLLGRVSDDEKIELYANCLAVYYGPFEEDYGYVTLEAMFSSKAVVTLSDSGGPLEFVVHEATGLVAEPDPRKLSQCIDRFYFDRDFASRAGREGRERIVGMDISWDRVVDCLTS